MKYTIELDADDTANIRSLVTQAWEAGKDWHESDDSGKERLNNLFGNLLSQANSLPQIIAKKAFAAGMQAPKVPDRHG